MRADEGMGPVTAGEARPQEGLLETAVGVISQPVPTLRRVTSQRLVVWGVIVYVVIAAVNGWVTGAQPGAFMLGDPAAPPPDPTAGERFISMLSWGILSPILGLIVLAVFTGLVQLVSMILGGKGPYAGLFAGFAFSYVPAAFAVPFNLLPLLIGTFGAVLSGMVSLAIAVWVIVLGVIATRENNGFTTGRAAAAYLIPLAVVLGLVLALVLLALAFFVITGVVTS